MSSGSSRSNLISSSGGSVSAGAVSEETASVTLSVTASDFTGSVTVCDLAKHAMSANLDEDALLAALGVPGLHRFRYSASMHRWTPLDDDLSLAAAAVPSVYVVGVATLLGAIGMVFFEAVSGTGNTTAAMALEFGVLIAYMFYVFLMSKTRTIAHVWTAEWFYNIVMGFIAFMYIWKADWRKKKI